MEHRVELPDAAPAQSRCRRLHLGICFLLFGVCGLVCSLVIPLLDSRRRSTRLTDLLTFSNTSHDYAQWLDSDAEGSVSTVLQAWVYNVTNPEQVLRGQSAMLSEVGPLSYQKRVQHLRVNFSATRQVFYEEVESYHGSNADLESKLVHTISPTGQLSAHTVGAVLWSHGMQITNTRDSKPGTVRNSSLMNRQNNRYMFDTVTGAVGLWRNQTAVNCWRTVAANQIMGGQGLFWHPDSVRNGQSLSWWDPVGQRHSALTSSSGLTIHNDLSGRSYQVDPAEDSATDANEAFGVDIKGIHNVSHCWNGSPLALTHPHFYGVPVELPWRSQLEGLRPATSDDISSLFVDSCAGRVLNYSHAWQLNAWLDREGGPLVPLVRFKESRTSVSAQTVDLIREVKAQMSESTVEKVLKTAGVGGSAFLFLVGICLLLSGKCHTRREVLPENEEKFTGNNFSITPLMLPCRETAADDQSLVTRMRSDSLQDVSYKVFSWFDFRHQIHRHTTADDDSAVEPRLSDLQGHGVPPSGSLRHEGLRDHDLTTA